MPPSGDRPAMIRPLAQMDRVAEALRKRIADGEFDESGGNGGRLPTERALCETYGVSRATIRPALNKLIGLGLIVNVLRDGYYVRHDNPIELPIDRYELVPPDDKNFSGQDQWETAVTRQGREVYTDVQVHVLGGPDNPAPDTIERALEIEHGAAVIMRERVCFVDGIPWMTRHSWFPYAIAQGTRLADPGDQAAPGGLLASIGRPAATWEDRYEARMATGDEVAALQLYPGTCGIDWMRVRIGPDGEKLGVMRAFLPAGRCALTDLLPAQAA